LGHPPRSLPRTPRRNDRPHPALRSSKERGIEAGNANLYGGVMKQQNNVLPGDVGRRVSFQYELPNGYVSEVVGTLEWFDEAAQTYVVKDRNDKLQRVPLRGVRFGKIVQ
jgi:hypothetical protein